MLLVAGTNLGSFEVPGRECDHQLGSYVYVTISAWLSGQIRPDNGEGVNPTLSGETFKFFG